MKKKILFIPLVIVCLAIIDLIVRCICTYAYNNVPEGSISYRSAQYQLNNKQSDILIVGASCGIHGYNPSILSDSLNCSAINASMDGQPVSFQCITANKAFSNGDVKIIIFDIAAPQLVDYWGRSISPYKPYYWMNKDAKEYVDRVRPWYEKLFMTSALYQYNNSFVSVLRILLHIDSRGDSGYLPIPYTGQPYERDNYMTEEPFEPDTLNLEYLDNLVAKCKEHNTQLILCKSPGIAGDLSFNNYVKRYAESHDVLFWDYNRCEGLTDDHTLFKDEVHLNEKGATIFTSMIAHRIKVVGLLNN